MSALLASVALCVCHAMTVRPLQAVVIPRRAQIVTVRDNGRPLRMADTGVAGFYAYRNKTGQICAMLHNRHLADWTQHNLTVVYGY